MSCNPVKHKIPDAKKLPIVMLLTLIVSYMWHVVLSIVQVKYIF